MSVFIILGLGGVEGSHDHAKDSARVVNAIGHQFLATLTLHGQPDRHGEGHGRRVRLHGAGRPCGNSGGSSKIWNSPDASSARSTHPTTAQRACLAGDLDAPSREKGLVFLAELLDRQARFADADAVIAEVDRQYPQSRPLDLYRQQRPMVQKQPMTVPVTR